MIETDFALPNNALSISAYATPGTNLSAWVSVYDADPAAFPAGRIAGVAVTTTGWVPAGAAPGAPPLPAAAFSPPARCGARACGTAAAAFSGAVRGLSAATNRWAVVLSFAGGALDWDVTAAWVVTIVVTDGLGGAATALR